MRVALFGGTFDPPHLGHLAIARAAAEAYGLDLVLFAPAGVQPLKRGAIVASYGQRVAMCGLMCAAEGRFVASEIDAPRADGRPNYTVDALEAVAREYAGATMFNLVGADSFEHLGQWFGADRLLDLAEWIVVSRPGFALREPEGMYLTAAQKARVHLLDSVHFEVSATELRARLAVGDGCDGLLAPAVAAYIAGNGLYRGVSGGIPVA